MTTAEPPAAHVLAGQAIVRRGEEVLICRNRDGEHFLPGGRLEDGERAADAVVRELLEETGWAVEVGQPLGVIHGYHETPEPEDAGRVLHPDWIWRVFEARAIAERPEARLAGDHELGGRFASAREARGVAQTEVERALLEAALGPRSL